MGDLNQLVLNNFPGDAGSIMSFNAIVKVKLGILFIIGPNNNKMLETFAEELKKIENEYIADILRENYTTYAVLFSNQEGKNVRKNIFT